MSSEVAPPPAPPTSALESDDLTEPPRPPRSRRRRRALLALAVVLSLLLGLGAYAYQDLAGRIRTFSGAGLSGSPKASRSVAGAENVLLIGSDARGGENTRLGGAGGDVGRSDTTLLVHVYPGHTSAVAVSIPRDTLVTIPRCRLPDGSWTQPQPDTMFNAAFSVGETPAGNPACTVNTVEQLTGLHVDHTVVANFAGFAAMSRAVGGVPVCLPQPVYQGDLNPNLGYAGRLVFPAGRQVVEGAKALQYVRVRHGLGDGSDIGRIQRQQAFLASLVMTVRRQGLTSSHLLPLVDAATRNLTFDPGLASPAQLLEFALSLRSLNPRQIDFVTMPWRYDGARVAVVQPAARRLWAALDHNQPIDGRGGAHGRRGSKSVRLPRGSGAVVVLNGTWQTGLAGRTAARLQHYGFTATAGNAALRNYSRSRILYPPADRDRARVLAGYLDAREFADPGVRELTLILGTAHQWRPAARRSASQRQPARLPRSVTGQMRKATSNPCADLTYG